MNRFGGHYVNEGFPGSLAGKESACNSILGSGRSPGEGNDNPLYYSWTEEPGGLHSMGSQSQT